MRFSYLIPVALALFIASAPVAGFEAFTLGENIAVPQTANRTYRLLVPEGAGRNGTKLPLVIYMHGAGSKGTDNDKPAREVLPALLAAAGMQARFPCFILVPQCRDGLDATGRPNNWVKWRNQKDAPPAEWTDSEPEPGDQLRAAMAAVDEVLARHPVDVSRVYLTGVSMGGSAAWWWAAHQPERFAAVVTACGLSEPVKATALKKTALWAFHGSDDEVAPVARSRSMIAAIEKAGGSPRFTEFTGAGHNIATRVLTEDDHAVLRWLFEQGIKP